MGPGERQLAAYRTPPRPSGDHVAVPFGTKQGRSPSGAMPKNGPGKNEGSTGRFGLDKFWSSRFSGGKGKRKNASWGVPGFRTHVVLMPPWEKFKRGPKELGSPPESIGWCTGREGLA